MKNQPNYFKIFFGDVSNIIILIASIFFAILGIINIGGKENTSGICFGTAIVIFITLIVFTIIDYYDLKKNGEL
jgi:amino acid transporter